MSIRRRLNQLLPPGQFARGISILAGSMALSQGLAIVASPLLTRLYSPEDFGMLAVFAATLSVLAVIAGLRYELAVPLPESDEDGANLVGLAILVATVLSILTAIVIVLCEDTIASNLGIVKLRPWLWLLPIVLFFTGIYQALYYAAVRKREYHVIGRTRLARAFAILTIQIISYPLGGIGLVLGHAAGQTVGFLEIGRQLRSNHGQMFRSALTWARIRVQAVRYKDFPLWSSPGALFNTVGAQLPVVLFALLFSPAVAGLYALTVRVLSMPAQLVGQAISDMIFTDGPTSYRDGRLGSVIASILQRLLWISVAPIAILALAAPEGFAVIFGPEWREAGDMARWLSPWLLVSFLASALSPVFSIAEKLRELVALHLAIGLVRVFSIFAGFYLFSGDFYSTFLVFAVFSAAMYVIFLYRTLACGEALGVKYGKSLLGAIAVTLVAVIPILLAICFFGPYGVTIAAVTSIGIYAFLLLKFQRVWLSRS